MVGLPELALDPKFATNQARFAHAGSLLPQLARVFLTRSAAEWQEKLNEALVPAGPIHDFAAMTQDPQIRERALIGAIQSSEARGVPFVANPIRFSDTPIRHERPPPTLDEHRDEILAQWMNAAEPEPRA